MKHLLPTFTFQILLLTVTGFFHEWKQGHSKFEKFTECSFVKSIKVESAIFKKYVSEFVPDTSIEDGMTKYEIPDSVVKSLKELRIDPEIQLNYLSIYFLKVYRGHLICCHQGYELRNYFDLKNLGIDSINDPFLYEFNEITNVITKNKPVEFINSNLAYEYVSKHKNLLENKEIKNEYRLITEKINSFR